MNDENSSLFYIEKNLENEYSMVEDDYNMLNEIYPDDIKEINNNYEKLYFLLKLKNKIEIQQSTLDLLISMKLDDLLDNNENNSMYLPYWIKIFYSKENKIIKVSIFVFWFKYETYLRKSLQETLSKDFDEPILYNIIDEIKNIIEASLTNNQVLLIEILKKLEI